MSKRRRVPPLRSIELVHGDLPPDRASAFAAVYALVRRIPRGRVMTYGQIATLIENRLSPRAVGWAMHGCPKGVPWQRVVNASGGCSTDRLPGFPPGLQRAMLEAEGVVFRKSGTVDLKDLRWSPPSGKVASPKKSRASSRGAAGRARTKSARPTRRPRTR